MSGFWSLFDSRQSGTDAEEGFQAQARSEGAEHAEATFKEGYISNPHELNVLGAQAYQEYWEGGQNEREAASVLNGAVNTVGFVVDVATDLAKGVASPALYAAEIMFTPKPLNVGEEEFLHVHNTYPQSFVDGARDEYIDQFDQRFQTQFGPSDDAWKSPSDIYVEQTLDRMEREIQDNHYSHSDD